MQDLREYYKEGMSSSFKMSYFEEIQLIFHKNDLHSNLGCANRGWPLFLNNREVNQALKTSHYFG